MTLRHVQFSAVVVGTAHNPTILNPDFLATHEIVPASWGWEQVETVVTPPLAAIRYSSGVAITVDQTRLQVVDVELNGSPEASKAAAIVDTYVKTLPHVHYNAVGLNFMSVSDMDSPQTYIKERLIKTGPWDTTNHPLTAAGTRLIYALEKEGERFILSFDAGTTQSSDGTQAQTLVVNANFHRPCTTYPAVDEVHSHLGNVSHDWKMYQDILATVLAQGGKHA